MFQAPEFYDVFQNEHDNIFSTTDPKLHSEFRRLISNGFSRKSVLAYEHHIWETAFTMLGRIQQDCEANAGLIDLTKVFRCYALDVVSKFTYGSSFEALTDTRSSDQLLEAFDKFSAASFFVSSLGWLRSISTWWYLTHI